MKYTERLSRLVEAWLVKCMKCESEYSTNVYKKYGKVICPKCGWQEKKYLYKFSESIDTSELKLGTAWGDCKSNSDKLQKKFGGQSKQISLAINVDGVNGHYYWTNGQYVVDNVIQHQPQAMKVLKSKQVKPGVWKLSDYKSLLGIQESLSKKVDMKTVKEVQDVDLSFDFATDNTIVEFSSFVRNFASKYGIGKKISRRFWGVKGYQDIQKQLYDVIEKQATQRKPVTAINLFDDLKQNVDGKKIVEYTPYHFSRVARTEGKAITTIYQLEKFKEAGLKYVKHLTRSDNKVARVCAQHNGREDVIEWLLSPAGEESRPPRHVNCRCRLVASMKGVGGDDWTQGEWWK